METTRNMLTVMVMMAVIGLAGGSANAAAIVEDFESSSAGSGTPPTGWSLVTVAGSPTYQTSAAGQGSDGAGGSTCLAGQVSSTASIQNQLPGAYLVNSVDLDLGSALGGSFDFMLVADDIYDDATFTIGAIADGITGNTAGELLDVKFYERTDGSGTNLANGSNVILDGFTSDRVQQDTWHKAEFSWTPTSGTTGDFSLTITDLSDSSTVGTLATTGFAFDSATAQVGFGSVNDTIRFDNVDINQGEVPEPATMALSALALAGLGGYVRRCRKA